MSIFHKITFSVSVIIAIFLPALLFYQVLMKNWAHKWNDESRSALKRALIFISIIVSAYLIVGVWDLPVKQLAMAKNILFTLSVLMATMIVVAIMSSIIEVYKAGGEHAIAAATLTKNIANTAIFIIGILILLNHFGIAITPMLTAMGIGGIAIALGLQDTLSNIFAGIYIIWAGRMQIGDYIKLSSGEEGYVHDIAWRETRITTGLENMLTIPNSLISKTSIVNYSRPGEDVGFLFSFGVDYKSDLNHVEKVTLEVARNILQRVPGGLADFEPSLRFKTFGDSSIDLQLKMRVRSYSAQNLINHELLKELHKRFREENISLPYPTRRIFQEAML